VSDHYLGMLDMCREVRSATRDQLIECVLELLGDSDVNQSAHLLAVIGRNVKPSITKLPLPEAMEKCGAEHYVSWPVDRNLPCIVAVTHYEHRDICGFRWNDG
jgi:hypothetical protein